MVLIENATPDAYAKVKGDKNHSSIQGTVFFHKVFGGTILVCIHLY